MSEMQAARSLYTASTTLSADCIEAHPRRPGLFALATYQVDQQNEQAETEELKGSENSGEANAQEDQVPTSSTSPDYTRRGTISIHHAYQTSDADRVQWSV